MTDKERKSCIQTIELLRRLAFNVHGVMDVIDNQNCDKIIEMLNKPETHWIPCSERLPEMGIDVLVCDEGESIWICSLAFDKKALCWEDNCGYIHNFKYWIAWQKLPEPYREGKNDIIRSN